MQLPSIRAIADRLTLILQGEPLRAISYGAAAVIYFTARALGAVEDVSFEAALVQAGAAAAILVSVVETARRYVFSPNTVEAIEAEVQSDEADQHAFETYRLGVLERRNLELLSRLDKEARA